MKEKLVLDIINWNWALVLSFALALCLTGIFLFGWRFVLWLYLVALIVFVAWFLTEARKVEKAEENRDG